MKAPVVFVVSPEWTLRTMVRAELREAGVEALGMQAASDLVDALGRGVAPSMVVIDGIELEKPAEHGGACPLLGRRTTPSDPGTRHRLAGADEARPQDGLKRTDIVIEPIHWQ